MRKVLLIGAAAAGLTLAAASAQATEFAGGWSLPTLQTTDPGLVVQTTKSSGTFDFTLTPDNPATHHVDESKTTLQLFTLYTDESSVNQDDLAKSPIELKFTFTLPTPNEGADPIDGYTTGEADWFGFFQNGELVWNTGMTQLYYGPNNLPQSAKGLLDITVNGGSFSQGVLGLDGNPCDGLTVSATFDWVRDPTVSAAPEPASWALMIGGFGLAGAGLRRRRAAVAT